jgi:DNA-binding XRE family transcriptional regulator
MHIKAARVNAQLTQAEVCKKLKERGFSTAVSTLVSWEAESTFPTVPIFKALCEIYGCNMNDIFVPETLT